MNNLDKWLLLSWKKVAIIIMAWIASVVLHNLVYVIFSDYFNAIDGDEPFFFLIAVFVIPIYLVVLVIYTIIKKLKTPNRVITTSGGINIALQGFGQYINTWGI